MANELKYGDPVTLQNGWANWTGGFLDVTGTQQPQAVFAVQTASTPKRDRESGTWKIASARGKADGTTVMSGDLVYLVNQLGSTSYLDVNGVPDPAPTGERYGVHTAATPNRNGNSGEWLLFAETSSPDDGAIRVGDVVHILSNWNNTSGGWLDTSGGGPGGNGLHTALVGHYSNRANGSGAWRFDHA
ncbi:hypothetical protein [Streptomyces sp. NPDC006739]|uniref:hypothetical protein n=1 Tax=Streptomyces sp. NPDC006739 TaxID=3364763 RepID=UPI0036C19558